MSLTTDDGEHLSAIGCLVAALAAVGLAVVNWVVRALFPDLTVVAVVTTINIVGFANEGRTDHHPARRADDDSGATHRSGEGTGESPVMNKLMPLDAIEAYRGFAVEGDKLIAPVQGGEWVPGINASECATCGTRPQKRCRCGFYSFMTQEIAQKEWGEEAGDHRSHGLRDAAGGTARDRILPGLPLPFGYTV